MLQGSFWEGGENLSNDPDSLFIMKLYFHLPTPPQYTHSMGEGVGGKNIVTFICCCHCENKLLFSLLHTESYHETLVDRRANLRHYLAINQTILHPFEEFIRYLVTAVWYSSLWTCTCGQIFSERKSDRCVHLPPHFNRMYKVSPTKFIKISPISSSDKREQHLYN